MLTTANLSGLAVGKTIKCLIIFSYRVKMFDIVGLLHYYRIQYIQRTGSIFLDGLVGGMFLSFLLDTEEKCDNKTFIRIFFYITIAHYLSKMLGDMASYSREAGRRDGVQTAMEKVIDKIFPYLLHLIRIIQFPLLLVLSYHVITLKIGELSNWTHDRELRDEKKEAGEEIFFCEANEIHIALVTVIFQFFYGLVILFSWTFLWAIDRKDDEAERVEEERWRWEEDLQSGSWWGRVKELVLVITAESFLDSQVAGTFLALALALPHESCNIHVTEWFLVCGVVSTLTAVINQLREEVQTLASLDGIINRMEHRLILLLRMTNFPLFMTQFVAFIMISSMMVGNWTNIENDPEKAKNSDGSHNPYFCEKGTWQLMVGVVIIYPPIILFRAAVVVGSLMKGP